MHSSALWFVLTFTISTILGASGQLVCPSAEDIAPCECIPVQERGFCFGEDFVQSDVDRLVAALRTANNIGPGQWLYVPTFEIMYSSLTTLNVTSLHLLQVTDLNIINNEQLTTIVGPWSDGSDSELKIRAQGLYLTTNMLTDEGLGQFLNHFDTDLLWSVSMSGNYLRGGQYVSDEGHTEFLPGFSKLRRLESISLGQNNITSVAGGQFRRQRRLYFISLSMNPITELGADAFTFDEQDAHMWNTLFQIGLTLVQVPDSKISPQNGMNSMARPVRLMLVQDYALETLTEDTWSGIVFTNPTSQLVLHYSTIMCDSRVKWMKDARAELEHRVEGAYCANDPDPSQTVFTSELVQ